MQKPSPSADSLVIVGLVQITEPMIQYVNIPYAVGLLQAYAQTYARDPARYLFLLPQFLRLPLAEAARSLSMARVVGFSAYVWNIEYSLALARYLKQQNPEVLIVFGGPQVPDRCEAFLQAHPEIDLCVHGEGEAVFLEILERFPTADWEGIPGLSRRGPAGEILTSAKGPRQVELDQIPSPFLTGVFDPLLLSHKELKWMGIWETNRGCPFSCTFCDWGSAVASKVYSFGMERLQAEIAWFARQKMDMLYCIDSNFGMMPRDLEITAEVIRSHQASGYPKILYTQAAKNVTERAYRVQKMLFDAGMNWVATLSLQSVSPAALKAIKRENISQATYQELQRRFRADGVPTYTDFLVGLPGETLDSFIQGLGTVIAQGQHRELRNWNTYILPNAEMAQPDYRHKYGIESVNSLMRPWLQPARDYPDGIHEFQEMLVASHSFTRQDWVKMRVFAWLAQVLYFGKALQLPMMLLSELAAVPYQVSLRAFLDGPLPPGSLVIEHLRNFLFQRAQEMAEGGPEYTAGFDPDTKQLVWMAPDYFAALQLIASPRLGAFYQECAAILERLDPDGKLPAGVLHEALRLGEALFFTQHPDGHHFELTLNWNLWECYQQVLAGRPPVLQQQPARLSYQLIDGHERVRLQPLAPRT